MEILIPEPAERQQLDRVVAWLEIPWSDRQSSQLASYRTWLATEAVEVGGVGPNEVPRLWTRHVLDSLVFGKGLNDRSAVLDVGTGAGLPGIPLAIAFPTCSVTLLDRAGRRIDALHRVTHRLGLAVAIRQGDVAQETTTYDRIVLRASLRLAPALTTCRRLLAPGGEAWFGLGRGEDSDAIRQWRAGAIDVPEELVAAEVLVPSTVLDSPVSLLRIARS